ncbi:MAG: diguanylate cyclase, partial [Bacteroidota bacterium]|nr:diguanylate cyclase [Bacteroidota bacterium]
MSGDHFRNTILLVDDSDLDRKHMAIHLEAAGYLILESDDGKDIENILDQNSVDLILLDIVLPNKDGLTILTKLRLQYTAISLPIIMLTSRGENADIVNGLSLGANDYVTKPADLSVLIARIKTHLLLKHSKEALIESEERYSLSIQGANDGIWDWNLRNNNIFFSPRWKALLGYGEHEFNNSTEDWYSNIHTDDLSQVKEAIKFHLESLNDHLEVEYRMLDKSGQFRWMLTRGMAIRDSSRKAYRIAGSQTDITESKLTDTLTGLPNRVLFMDRLFHANNILRRHIEASFAVCVLNIDRFTTVNGSLGQAAGDLLLKEFSRRLQECLRPEDAVARFGGDEFVVLLEGLKSNEDVTHFVERINKKISFPFKLNGEEIFITISVGIVYNNLAYQRAEDLVRDAQIALKRAKERGVSNFQVFDPTMHAQVIKRFQMESDLRKAIEDEELLTYFQPIVSITRENERGYEALVRWNRPNRGILLPDDFISIAEETGLIVPLGEYVLQTACVAMKQLNQKVYGEHFVSVNFSGKQFQQNNIIDTIEKTLKISDLDPKLLKIELTESILMENLNENILKLKHLREMGLQILID